MQDTSLFAGQVEQDAQVLVAHRAWPEGSVLELHFAAARELVEGLRHKSNFSVVASGLAQSRCFEQEESISSN